MTYFSIFQPLIAGGFVLFALYASFRRRPDWLMGAVLASMGFGNFWIFAANSIWSPIKLTSMIGLGYVVFLSRNSMKGIDPGSAYLFIQFCVWTLICCIIGLALPLEGVFPDGGGFQSSFMRPIIQLLGYSASLSLFPLALLAAREKSGLACVLSLYNFAVVIVLAFAFVQLAFHSIGVPFMPIYRPHGFHSAVAAFSFRGDVVFRLYSTAGEPKSLGVFLTPHAMIGAILFFRPRNEAPYWWNRRILFVLSSIVCILTFSTAVLIALGLGWAVAIALSVRKDYLVASLLAVGITASILFLFGSAFELVPLDSRIGGMVYERTVERLESEARGRLEAMAWDLLLANPADLVVGFGLGMFVFHIPGLVYSGGIEPIDSGWMTLMMDMGVVGVGLLGLFILGNAQRLFRPGGGGLKIALVACMLACAFLNFGTGALPGLMIWSGLVMSSEWRRRVALPS